MVCGPVSVTMRAKVSSGISWPLLFLKYSSDSARGSAWYFGSSSSSTLYSFTEP